MIYRYYLRDSITAGVTPVKVVGQAEKQSGSFAILTTEEPTGPQRQVLLMHGKVGRDKVPVVHPDDSSVKNIVGSCMLRTRGQELCGVLGFASDKTSQAIRARYLNGELTVHLITNPIAGVEIKRGENFRGVAGPATVLTEWEPLQVVLEDPSMKPLSKEHNNV